VLTELWKAGYAQESTVSARVRKLMQKASALGLEDSAADAFNQGVAESTKLIENPGESVETRYWVNTVGADGRLNTFGVVRDEAQAKEFARHIKDSGVPGPIYVHAGTLDDFDSTPAWIVDDEPDGFLSTLDPRSSSAAKHFNYWIDPYGDVYPVPLYGHENVQEMLIEAGMIVKNGQNPTLFNYAPALASGWLRVSSSHGTPTFAFVGNNPSQRQLDAVFDLALAHKDARGAAHLIFAQKAMNWISNPVNELAFIGNPSKSSNKRKSRKRR